jgi:hypothetical protein
MSTTVPQHAITQKWNKYTKSHVTVATPTEQAENLHGTSPKKPFRM